MPSIRQLTLALAMPAMLLTVSGCGGRGATFHTYPPAPDVRVEPKPVAGPEVFESEQAAREYDSALEAWGERGWAAVGRICRDAVRKGAPYPDGWCPEAQD